MHWNKIKKWYPAQQEEKPTDLCSIAASYFPSKIVRKKRERKFLIYVFPLSIRWRDTCVMSNSKNGRGNPYDEYLKISGRRRNFAIEEVVPYLNIVCPIALLSQWGSTFLHTITIRFIFIIVPFWFVQCACPEYTENFWFHLLLFCYYFLAWWPTCFLYDSIRVVP